MAMRRRGNSTGVAVIGGGIAGLTAACHAARRGLGTVLIEADIACGGQVANINELDGWPAVGETSGVALAAALVEEARSLGVEVLHQPAATLAADGVELKVEVNGRTVRSRRAILATGATLRSLGVANEETFRGRGLSQCARCDGEFFRGQDVVVIGGGDAALQEALVLADICRSVIVVVRSTLRARRAYVEKIRAKANVKFIWDCVVDAIVGEGAVAGVRLRNRKTSEITEVPCTGVFPFIGVEPNTAIVPNAVERDARGYVVTDRHLRTSVPGLFAVGAVRAGYDGDLICAAGEAAAAAATIAHELSE